MIRGFVCSFIYSNIKMMHGPIRIRIKILFEIGQKVGALHKKALKRFFFYSCRRHQISINSLSSNEMVSG